MLAIVIPYYKLTFFEATLQSLANQTDQRFKVYIGDDASPESPLDLLAKYQDKFDFHYHKFETNLGGISLVKQWERCLELTYNEEWVMFLGDDDVLENNCVSAFYENLKEIEALKINVIRFATKVIGSFGEPISKIHVHPKLENSVDFLMRKFKGGTRSTLSEYVFKKQIVETIKFKELPLAWFSDLLAVLEFSKFGLIYTINEALVHFRLSEINITGKKNDLLLKNSATFNFYYYLLTHEKSFFKSTEANELLIRLEKTFLDNKKNPYFWLQLTKLYLSNFYLKRYFLLLIKSFQFLLKKK
ncbi:MAG: glycosyltransferase family 2 protein [Bacteroidetes bacterium HGW-Bacteroidetes-18]|nr:MAG: glycosyltransferase family 2 protein [Bacteroidetes bacterium HGW-Bacteroidetes-18]